MAWEWVAPVVTGVVGVAGIAGTYLNGRHQANATVRLTREERTQTRLERAYLEVQRVVERNGLWADAVMPTLSGTEQDLYPLPPDNDAVVAEASAMQLYWSKEVRGLIHVWTDARNKLAQQSMLARNVEALRADGWVRAPDLKKAMNDAADALLERMAAELRGSVPH